MHPFVPGKPGYPEVMVLTHNEQFQGAKAFWHNTM